jgi:hypothetical protein
LILQAYTRSKTPFTLEISKHFSYTFEEVPISNVVLSSDLLNSGVSLTAALSLANTTSSIEEVINIAVALTNIMNTATSAQQALFLPLLLNCCTCMKECNRDHTLILFLHMLVVKIISRQIAPEYEIAKNHLFIASKIAKNNITSRNVYVKITSCILRQSSAFMETLEPHGSSNSVFNLFRLLVINESKLLEGDMLKRQVDFLVNFPSQSKIYIPVNFIKIELARLALRENKHDSAAILVRSITKLSIRSESKYAGALLRLVKLQVSNTKITPEYIQAICTSLKESQDNNYPDLSLYACIQLWNDILEIMGNRQEIIRALTMASEILDSISLTCNDLKMLYFIELSACYESFDLLSLSLSFLQRASLLANDKSVKDELHSSRLRIEMKLKNPIEELGSSQKGLF